MVHTSRKHFECVMYDIGKFHGICENNLRWMTSGMSYDDVWESSNAQFTTIVNSMGFNHWEAYHKLKDHPKFQIGIQAAMAPGSRRMKLVGS